MHPFARRLLSLLPLLLIPLAAASAQENDPRAEQRVQSLREITRDVWEPFVRGVNSFDDPTYLAVRSENFVLVQSEGRNFLDHDYYVEDTIKVMRGLKDAGVRLEAELRFDERFADAEHASERGMMRIARTGADGIRRVGHSRFHAISRKEDGRWRVLTEYRWSTDPEADARAFDAARPADDVEAFR